MNATQPRKKSFLRIGIILVIAAALAVIAVQFFSSEAPAPTATTTSGKRPAGAVKYYRSTMTPGEISPTPRKDSMGMDMVPVFESDESMLTLSEHARAMASVETAPVERRKLSREIRAVGKVQYNE